MVLRGYPRWQCLPERRRLGPIRQGQLEQPRVDSGRGQDRTLRLLSALWPPVFAGEQDVWAQELGLDCQPGVFPRSERFDETGGIPAPIRWEECSSISSPSSPSSKPDLIRMRTREGMAIARAKGELRGKQPKLSNRQQRDLCRIHAAGEYSISDLAKLFSVSRPTVYGTLNRRHSP